MSSRPFVASASTVHVPRTRLPSVSGVLAVVTWAIMATPMVAFADHGISHAVNIVDIDFSEGERPDEVGSHTAAGRWRLNLVIPAGCAEPVPVFIDNPGSAWSTTNTKTASHGITAFCYAFVGVNDSASSLCKFPCQTHDMNAAIRWLRAYANGWTNPANGQVFTWRLDPNRIAVSGFSSGGWQAAFEGTTNGADRNGTGADFSWPLPGGGFHEVDLMGTIGKWEGIYSSDAQAVVPLHPPTDFSLMDPPYSGTGPPSALNHDAASSPESNLVGCTVGTSRNDGNPLYPYSPLCHAKVQSANPIHYISHDDPPFFDFHGSSDSLVPHGQSVYLYEALRDHCRTVFFFSMDGQNHVPIYAGLNPPAPHLTFESVNCVEETPYHGPPETHVHSDLTVHEGYRPNWAGVADFLNERMRETTPPDLIVSALGNPGISCALLTNGFIAVDVTTDEASWYNVVATIDGVEVGTASVDIYDWGAGYPANAPSPYTATIQVPISNPGAVAAGGTVTVQVTARDRVANAITLEDTFAVTVGDCDGDSIIDDVDNCPQVANADQADIDGDGVGDVCDNCTEIANPTQCDTNADGYGNHCDADLNNNGVINFLDLSIIKTAFFGSFFPDADLNCSGVVNFTDLAIMKASFFGAPGPSGIVAP